ncbi:Protein of unknown function [Gryllus bimaculatus]|nr:Protein of unknown function [Gryllus bimaculatus]
MVPVRCNQRTRPTPPNEPGVHSSSPKGSLPAASPRAAPPPSGRWCSAPRTPAGVAADSGRASASPAARPRAPWEPKQSAPRTPPVPRALPPPPPPLAVVGCVSDLSGDDNTDNDEALKRTNIEKLVSFTKNNKPFTKISPVPAEDQRLEDHALEYEREANSPLDLSMDALDLRKKRESVLESATKDETNDLDEDSVPQDLSKKKLEFNNNNPLIVASAFAAARKCDSSPPPPPPPPALRGAASPLFGAAAGAGPGVVPKMEVIADSARNKDPLKIDIKEPVAEMKPLVKPLPPSVLHNNNNVNSNNNNSIKSGRERDAPGAVKMVIKNGVLMPKQKQRRYRTERPFACEHCSARFTLRSNMERHVKQQHPQFWSQRQRGATAVVNGPGRRPTVNVPIPPLPQHPSLPVPQPKIEPVDEKKPITPPILNTSLHISSPEKEGDQGEEDNNNKFTSDEVRHLIAQQLKSKLGTTSPEPVEEEDARPQPQPERKDILEGGSADLASVSRLLDNASTQTQAFQRYFRGTQDAEEFGREEGSEEDEEGLVAGSNSLNQKLPQLLGKRRVLIPWHPTVSLALSVTENFLGHHH